jgi:hypothetical protein
VRAVSWWEMRREKACGRASDARQAGKIGGGGNTRELCVAPRAALSGVAKVHLVRVSSRASTPREVHGIPIERNFNGPGGNALAFTRAARLVRRIRPIFSGRMNIFTGV